jgi:hypothetical protein
MVFNHAPSILFWKTASIRMPSQDLNKGNVDEHYDRLCGLVVRVPGCQTKGPGTIPGDSTLSE